MENENNYSLSDIYRLLEILGLNRESIALMREKNGRTDQQFFLYVRDFFLTVGLSDDRGFLERMFSSDKVVLASVNQLYDTIQDTSKQLNEIPKGKEAKEENLKTRDYWAEKIASKLLQLDQVLRYRNFRIFQQSQQ